MDKSLSVLLVFVGLVFVGLQQHMVRVYGCSSVLFPNILDCFMVAVRQHLGQQLD
jgi:hypothetical protein